MEFSDFQEQFRQALSCNETITFFCSCSLEYHGRAEAELPRGDRIIIVKSDNTLLVHQPENSSPVNYMKSGTAYDILKENGRVLIKATRMKETMDVAIYRIYNFMRQRLEDGQSLELMGTEAHMSDMIKENPALISKNFIPLSREEHTKFGFIDVFGHDGNGSMVVVECKRYSAGLDAVQQLRRYVEKVKELKGTDRIKGIIASPSITSNAKGMLEKWGFKWVLVKPPKRLEKYNKHQKSLGEYEIQR